MKAKMFLIFFAVILLVLGRFNSTVYPESKEYPNRPIQIIVPHSAGGGTDTLIRLLSNELTKTWKVKVTVLNKPGGGRMLAGSEVANAERDGYIILGMLVSNLVAMSVANPMGPVNLFRDFNPLAVHYSYAPNLLITYSESQFKSLEEVVDYAKQKPGELICGSGGVGADVTLEVMLLNRSAKINLGIMHFEGTAEVIINVLGKHLPLGMVGFVPARPHIAAGKIRVLASDSTSSMLDAPTFAGKGYPEVNVISSIVFAGPKGLPATAIKTWENTIEAIAKDPNFVDTIKKRGYTANFLIGAERDKYLRDEIKNFSRFTPEELGWKK